MGLFVDKEVHRIELGDGDWVDVKKEMSIGDWERYEGSILQVEAGKSSNGNRASRRRRGNNGNEEDIAPTYKMSAGYLELLLINIVSWSSDSIVQKSTIGEMKESISDEILKVITELNENSPFLQISSPVNPISNTETISQVEGRD